MALTRPYKSIFRGGWDGDPPLEMFSQPAKDLPIWIWNFRFYFTLFFKIDSRQFLSIKLVRDQDM